MKYLLVLTVVFVAIWVWRNNRRSERAEAPPARPPQMPAVATRMIACAQCGMHLPEHEAVTGRRGQYCCHEHRRQREEG